MEKEPPKNLDKVYDCQKKEKIKRAYQKPRQYSPDKNYGITNNALILDDHLRRIREVTDDPLAECIFSGPNTIAHWKNCDAVKNWDILTNRRDYHQKLDLRYIYN